MSLVPVLDALGARLGAALPDARVGDEVPGSVEQLPAVAVSLSDVAPRLRGIGSSPGGERHGALPVTLTVDLAEPGQGALSADRRVLTLPHGPVVRADGTSDPPFGTGDVDVDDGAAFTVVDGAPPTGRQVRVDAAAGTLEFGVPLATAGELEVIYHLGRWEVETSRYRGRLTLVVHASDTAGVRDLGRRAADALSGTDGGLTCTPTSWGGIGPLLLGTDDTRAQNLGFDFDAELENPVLTSGGGVISTVPVAVRDGTGAAMETFVVHRQGSGT